MKYTKEQINDIIHLVGANDKPIDIFKLHGVLFIGNVQGRIWDVSETYTRQSEHSLPIFLEDFEYCETEQAVHDQFHESLKDVINERLI